MAWRECVFADRICTLLWYCRRRETSNLRFGITLWLLRYRKNLVSACSCWSFRFGFREFVLTVWCLPNEQLRPGFCDAWSNLASAYMRQGRLDEAAQCCRHALTLNPRLVSAHLLLHESFDRLSQPETGKFRVFCRRILEMFCAFASFHVFCEGFDLFCPSPPVKQVDAHSNLGNLFKQQGLTQHVRHIWTRAFCFPIIQTTLSRRLLERIREFFVLLWKLLLEYYIVFEKSNRLWEQHVFQQHSEGIDIGN